MGREISPVFMDRRDRGMTRAEYAEFLGYGASGAPKLESGIHAIARWETEGVPRNSVRAISRLCAATGRPAAFFTSDDAAAPDLLATILRVVDERIAAAGISVDPEARRYGRRATDRKEMVA